MTYQVYTATTQPNWNSSADGSASSLEPGILDLYGVLPHYFIDGNPSNAKSFNKLPQAIQLVSNASQMQLQTFSIIACYSQGFYQLIWYPENQAKENLPTHRRTNFLIKHAFFHSLTLPYARVTGMGELSMGMDFDLYSFLLLKHLYANHDTQSHKQWPWLSSSKLIARDSEIMLREISKKIFSASMCSEKL